MTQEQAQEKRARGWVDGYTAAIVPSYRELAFSTGTVISSIKASYEQNDEVQKAERMDMASAITEVCDLLVEEGLLIAEQRHPRIYRFPKETPWVRVNKLLAEPRKHIRKRKAAGREAQLAEKNQQLAEKEQVIAEKDQYIAQLEAQLKKSRVKVS